MARKARPPRAWARLNALVADDGATGGVIVSRHAYRLSAVRIEVPALIVPLEGSKRVHAGNRTFECAPTQFVLLHRALTFDVENLPDGPRPYRALALSFPWRLVEVARLLLPTALPARAPAVSLGRVDDILDSLEALLTLDRNVDAAVRDHALVGVLVSLARAAPPGVLAARKPGLESRVRQLLASDPGRPWTSALVERALAVSGATLRRQLAAQETSLREILREARLHHALDLLQTTRRPVKAVALACGYRSVASFRRQFVARFGTPPSVVGNA